MMLFGKDSRLLAGGLMIVMLAVSSVSAAAAAGDDFDFQKIVKGLSEAEK